LETLGLDKVYLQEVMVPKWVRGEKEIDIYKWETKNDISDLCAGSVATPKGIKATVIEVKSLEERLAKQKSRYFLIDP
jgi:hypothetical protein